MRHAHDGIPIQFGSLEEALEFIGTIYPAAAASRGRGAPDSLPSYLYRGEPVAYGSTLPSIVRILSGLPGSAVRELLIELEGDFLGTFEEQLGARASGLSQHYGLPTDYVEFTSSLPVAAFFACSNPASPDPGLIGVLDVSRAVQHCAIVSLSGDDDGSRPGKQQAYALRQNGRNLCDYKDPCCCERLGLTWYAFERAPESPRPFPDLTSITDASHDSIAEWMTGRIQSYRARMNGGRPEVERVLCAMETHLS